MAKEPLAVTASEKPGVMHDYSGFPEEFYRLDYPSPGDPKLAEEVADILLSAGFSTKVDKKRPFDHGAWVPLSRLYPKADIPTIQLTVPDVEDKRRIFEVGRALSQLRERGILLIGAGALSHNLRLAFAHEKNDPADGWVLEFDSWISNKLNQGNIEGLLNYRSLAPSARLAAPTSEHFDPLFFVLGAAGNERPTHFYQGIRNGNGVMRAFAFGL